MESQLQQLIDLQTEQNELLKRHLLRLRFSLAALLLMTTVCCLTLGYVTYRIRDAGTPVPVTPIRRPMGPYPIKGGGGTYPGGPQVPINTSPPISGTSRPVTTSPGQHV